MSAPFPHRRELLRLVREAALYNPAIPCRCEWIPSPRLLEPQCFDWRALFHRLDTLRTAALAAGDHEAVLLVDVVRILANVRDAGKRHRFGTVFTFLMDELEEDPA